MIKKPHFHPCVNGVKLFNLAYYILIIITNYNYNYN